MSRVRYDLSTSIPAAIDDFGKSSYRETAERAESPDSVVGMVEIVAHLLMAMIIFFAMWRSAADVRNALIAAVLYFGLVTTLRILARTHTLSAAWRCWLEYKLERHRIDAYEYLVERRLELEQPRVPESLPAAPVQAPSAPGSRFVPAYPPGVVDEALAWVRGLYGRDGHLDRRRVRSGYVQGSVVGSKRAGGSVEAKQLLIDAKVLKPVAGGYLFNVRRYPTLGQVDGLAARLRDGVGGGPGGPG